MSDIKTSSGGIEQQSNHDSTTSSKYQSTLESKIRFWLETSEGRSQIGMLYQKLLTINDDQGKSEEKSILLKEKGTEAYSNKSFAEAQNLYTDALRHAPDKSSTIPLLYANRSAALFERGDYQNCLSDIQHAEDESYPPDLRHKLILRKAKVLLKLGKYKEALQFLGKATVQVQHIDSKSPQLNIIKELEKECNKNETKVEDDNSLMNGTLSEGSFKETIYRGECDQVASMSAALTIKSNPNEGRHIVAQFEIPEGSIILREKPFASILLPENALTHCQLCLKETQTPLPCAKCINVVWCSEDCRTNGQHLFHQYECSIFLTLSKLRLAHLALRILIVAGIRTCMKIRSEVAMESSACATTTIVGKTLEERYKAVYSRVTHLEKFTPEDELNYATVAIILAKKLLEKTPFMEHNFPINNFESNLTMFRNTHIKNSCNDAHIPSPSLRHTISAIKTCSIDHQNAPVNKMTIDICCILMHHIALGITNAHGIDEYRKYPSDSDALIPVYLKQIASAIYPSASLMNHSCKIYTINSFDGDLLEIRNVEPLKLGEQVYTCYGPLFGQLSTSERNQKLHKQYFFDCTCIACTDPTFSKKEIEWSALKCPECSNTATWTDSAGNQVLLEKLAIEMDQDPGIISCVDGCGYTKGPGKDLVNKYLQISKCYSDGQNLLSQHRLHDAKTEFTRAYCYAQQFLLPNNAFLNTVKNSLAKTLAQCGEMQLCLQELLQFLVYIKDRHGENSAEAAFEMIRIVAILKIWRSCGFTSLMDTTELEESTCKIFTLLYGRNWRSYVGMIDL